MRPAAAAASPGPTAAAPAPAATVAPAATPSAPVVQPTAPQAPPRPTQPRPASTGQQPNAGNAAPAAAAQPVLNATPQRVPAPSGLSKEDVAVMRDTLKATRRLMLGARVPRDVVNDYIGGLFGRYDAVNSGRYPLEFFIEDDLPQFLQSKGYSPEQARNLSGDAVDKIRGWGRERHASNASGDSSRYTMQDTIHQLTTSQKDELEGTFKSVLGDESLTGREDEIRALMKRNGEEAYTNSIAEANRLIRGGTASTDQVKAAKELNALMATPAYKELLPESWSIQATTAGKTVDELLAARIAQDPIATAHWLQSEIGAAERAARNVDGSPTNVSRAYEARRDALLERLEAFPGYRGSRMQHGDLGGAEDAITAGDRFLTVAKSERQTDLLARRIQRMSPRQQEVAALSIRDALLNPLIRLSPEDAAARITQLQNEGTLRALVTVLGPERGDALRNAIADMRIENQRIAALSQGAGSNTHLNTQNAKNAVDNVRGPLNKAVHAVGNPGGWAVAIGADLALGTHGAITGAKAVGSIVDRLSTPGRRFQSRATKGLYGLPQADRQNNALAALPTPADVPPTSTPPMSFGGSQANALAPPKSPRAPKPPVTADEWKSRIQKDQDELQRLLRQYDQIDRNSPDVDDAMRANLHKQQLARRRIADKTKKLQATQEVPAATPNALSTPPRPPVKAGFGGSKQPLPMDGGAARDAKGIEFKDGLGGARIGPAEATFIVDGDNIRIPMLRIGNTAERGKGAASRLLDAIIHKADAEGKRIFLTPEPVATGAGLTQRQLEKFYRSRGFVPNKGRSQDFEFRESFVRNPSKRSSSLPMDEASRMQRAREQGFDVETPLYHGTAVEVDAFDAAKRGGVTNARSAKLGTWLTENPQTASGYADLASQKPVADLIKKSEAAERAGQWDKANEYMVQAEKLEASGGAGGQNTIPLYVRGKMKTVDMDGVRYDPDDHDLSGMVRAAKAEGFDGVRFENFSDEAEWGVHRPTTHVVIFDPANIRGKFAAFDPSQSGSSKLLAGMGGRIGGQLGPPAAAATIASVGPEGESNEDKLKRMATWAAAASGVRNAGALKRIGGGVFKPQTELMSAKGSYGSRPSAMGDLTGHQAAQKQLKELEAYRKTAPASEHAAVDQEIEDIRGFLDGSAAPTQAGFEGPPKPANALKPGDRRFEVNQSTFGGVNAKTADRIALGRAQNMEAEGATRDAIWDATGWFKGNDGKWRFEIDDSGAKLTGKTHGFLGNTNAASERLLGDGRPVLEHSELYDAYPDLKGAHASISGKGGEYTPVSENNFETVRAGQEDPLSILLHEAGGHGVQAREDFARGGSMSGVLEDPELREMVFADARSTLTPSRFEAYAQKWDISDTPRARADHAKLVEQQNQALSQLSRLEEKTSWDGVTEVPVALRQAAHRVYSRLAGETEARNVQSRDAMRRRGEEPGAPWTTQDVPDDQQIVRYGAGKQESRPPKPSQAGLTFGGGKGPPQPQANALASPPKKPRPVEARREAPRGNKPFNNPSLSQGENKISEMLLNGYEYPAIADEMMTSVDVVKQLAKRAQDKLGDAVKLPRPGMGKRPVGSTKREAAFGLFDEGLDNATIAQRTGLSLGNVRTYRSYWKQESGAPVANVNGASYNPPEMPPRPFEADYPQKDWPNGPPVDAQGRLVFDMEGRPLNQNATIVGRSKAPGVGSQSEADRPLRDKTATIQTLRNTGSEFERTPRENLPGQTDGYWNPSYADNGRFTGRGSAVIADDLDRPVMGLDDQELMTIAHELAHNIDFKTNPARSVDDYNARKWGIDPADSPGKAKVNDQLLRIYRDLNNAPGAEAKIGRPLDRGYQQAEEARELWAEAIRAYMWDPNYIKTVAPDVAFMIRHHVNRNSSLRKTIQFNAIPTIVGVGGLGLGAAALNGQPAEAKTRSSGMRANALAPAQNNRP